MRSILVIFFCLIFMPYIVFAYVTGPCANCHTMHASQSPWPSNWGNKSELPQSYLLAKTGSSACVGCHSSAESSTYYYLGDCKVPVVLYKGSTAPTSYLAGGNFWWVKEGLGGDDSKGHNVFLGEDDDFLSSAPGATITCGTNACHQNLSEPYSGSDTGDDLPGKYGCQGCHLHVRHHANDHPNGQSGLVDSADEGWYRFLSGHQFTGKGVKGYEDGDWEAGLHDGGNHQGATEHNGYLGAPGSNQVNSYSYGFALGYTTTAFCTGCHGRFHEQQRSDSAWVRHPSDVIIPNEGEYQYMGGTTHLYDPLSPVARASLSDPPTDPGKVNPGTDMVMCLSCHRPHGSPYPDLLRWDYTKQLANGGGDDRGCFYCHTEKN